MKMVLDLNSIADYRKFLKIKSLPVYRFTGREAEFPDEYASLVGFDSEDEIETDYEPIKGLFDYQEAISALAIRKQKYAVFLEPGMGKTLIMLEFARHAAASLPADKSVLIVSPLMVINQTLGECHRFYGNSLSIEQIRAKDLDAWTRAGSRVGITNYEAITDSISRGRVGALILDESSLLKSHYGKWGQRLIEIGRGLKWKLCLTGTPAPNDRIEYANHAVFLDQFPNVNSFLARFFVNRGQTDNRWELKPHALAPFYRALSHWSIFVSDPSVYGWNDNAGGMPPIHVEIQDVNMTDEQNNMVMKETKSLFVDAGGIGSRTRLAQIAKGSIRGKRVDTLKPEFIVKLAKRFSSDSVIIWCRFNAEQDRLAEMMPDAANISGDTSVDERIRLIGEFQRGEKKVLISKPKILGFGLNLQICTRMIFSSLHDSFEEYYQAVKRANRVGSTRPLHVYIPITEIERPMVETVLRKCKMVESDTIEQQRIFREQGVINV